MGLIRQSRKHKEIKSSKALCFYGLILLISFAFFDATPLFPLRSEAAPLSGSSSVAVIDGDTIEVDGSVIQLFGIDAPELGQSCTNNGQAWPCGLNASFALKMILDVERAPASCRLQNEEKAPPAGICTVGYVDLAEQLLLDGYAVAMGRSLPEYRKAQRNAKRAQLGVWRGQFVTPGVWRLGQRLSPEAARVDGMCFVKGIVDPKSHRIYYVPTDEEYDRIEVDHDKGGRCFASDDLARDAGWRRQSEQRRLPD